MDDVNFSKKANISVINRFDQQVKDIIISASQVALYVFDAKKAKWIKRKVEGACFFYKRKTSPKYGIFILNRLDTTNFIELMNSTMDIQLQEPYILYRNIFKTIYGIWFYEKSECTAMATVFQQILNELKEKEKEDDDSDSQMKDKACTANLFDENGTENNPTPNSQPDSVRQFFAKACKEATKSQPLVPQQPSCSRTICSSFQSVAHIEKAQKTDQYDNTFAQSAFDIGSSKNHDEESDKNFILLENNLKAMNVGAAVPRVKETPHNFLINDLSTPNSEFPELIPPGMLLTPDLSLSIRPDTTASVEKDKNHILSKNQMIEAMQYLLEHDTEFADKLYDAYLKISKTD